MDPVSELKGCKCVASSCYVCCEKHVNDLCASVKKTQEKLIAEGVKCGEDSYDGTDKQMIHPDHLAPCWELVEHLRPRINTESMRHLFHLSDLIAHIFPHLPGYEGQEIEILCDFLYVKHEELKKELKKVLEAKRLFKRLTAYVALKMESML